MTVSRGFSLDRSLLSAFYLFHAPRFFRVKRMGMDLDWTDFDGMVREWHLWESTYIPAGGLNGKTVLDIGACAAGPRISSSSTGPRRSSPSSATLKG